MPTQVEVFTQLKDGLLGGVFDLDTNPIKVMLVDSTYAFSAAHTQKSQVTGEITGTGYTAGGKQLTSPVIANGAFDAADVVWTAGNFTLRRAIVYQEGVYGALTDPLLFSILFDDTPADIAVVNTDFSIIWASGGLVVL